MALTRENIFYSKYKTNYYSSPFQNYEKQGFGNIKTGS
jgi:hypothetical protein